MEFSVNDTRLKYYQRLLSYFHLSEILDRNSFSVTHEYHAMDLRGQIFKQESGKYNSVFH